jgi:hypothetical protein
MNIFAPVAVLLAVGRPPMRGLVVEAGVKLDLQQGRRD